MSNTENLQTGNEEPAEIEIKKKKYGRLIFKIIIPVLALAIILTSVFGIVWAKKKFHDGPEGFIIEHLTKNLNLTDVQKAQVDRIKDQIKERMESKKGNREADMNEFANEFKKDNLDKNTLTEMMKKHEESKEEMKAFMMDKLIEFHNILTPEQRNKAVEEMKNMKNKFHDKMEKSPENKE